MATLRIGDFKANEPVELTLKYPNFRHVAGAFGPQAMLKTSLGTLYLDPEPASNIETQMRDLAIEPGEKIRMTRIRKPRGYDWEIQRIEPLEEQLTKSPEARPGNGNSHGGDEFPESAARPEEDETAATEVPTPEAVATPDDPQEPSAPPPAPPSIPPGTLKLMACFMQAIDAVAEAQIYCCRKGLKIAFTSEDIRATAISCWISCRDGGAR